MPMTTQEANDLLPAAPVKSKPNPSGLVYLMICPPKWGKTTFMCSVPDALLLAFERGHQFQEAYKVAIDAWDQKGTFDIYDDEEGTRHMTMKQASAIIKASDRFNFVIFDTADMAAKMCAEYYLKQNGWQHPQDGGDYGKGYDIVQNGPFRQLVGEIMRTGRGVGFITHSEIKTTDLQKKKVAKRETTLPGGIHKFLHTQADVILHGSFGGKRKGAKSRDRILQTEGDEETLAGNRTKEIVLPARYIVDPVDPWGQWCKFFEDPTAAAQAEAEIKGSKVHEVAIEEQENAPETPAPADAEAKSAPVVEEEPTPTLSKSRKKAA